MDITGLRNNTEWYLDFDKWQKMDGCRVTTCLEKGPCDRKRRPINQCRGHESVCRNFLFSLEMDTWTYHHTVYSSAGMSIVLHICVWTNDEGDAHTVES